MEGGASVAWRRRKLADVRGRGTWGRLTDAEADIDVGGGYNQRELMAVEVGRAELA